MELRDYAAALEANGTRTLPGSGSSLWVRYDKGAMVRMPTFYWDPPTHGEVRSILWSAKAAVASYIRQPDTDHPANGWLYTCCGGEYSVEKLSKPAQRCVRRAKRDLKIAETSVSAVLSHGFRAYRDTFIRLGVGTYTLEQFHSDLESFGRNPAHRFIAAWRGDLLVAFMMLIVVQNWVEIPALFSSDAHRDLRPNDGLANYVLDRYLAQDHYKIVSYGLSSVQETSNLAGLHAFKIKVGFKPHPVHRAFVIHPVMRPLVNRVTLWGTRTALRVCPEVRLLRKASGVLANLLTPQSPTNVLN